MRLLRNLIGSFAKTKVNAHAVTPVASTKRSFAQVHNVPFQFENSTGKAATGASGFQQEQVTKAKMPGELNVLKKPLALHSTNPLTGYLRTGYCEVPKTDAGNHSIAGILTNEFLDFSAARGNDLRAAGLTEGCKWCLCVSRWKEAFDARMGDEDRKVPKVVLKATNERALSGVRLEDLRKFAVDKD